jgi:beta-lactamase regulating signal transducer with metallopeptidase domain
LGTLVLLLLLPLFGFLPKVSFEVPGASDGPMNTAVSSIPLLGLVWLVGFVVACLLVLRDYRALRRWFTDSQPITDERLLGILGECQEASGLRTAVALRQAPRISSPCVAGMLHPAIYLPASSESWSAETLRMVLLHELGHIARRDLWTSLTARLACLVHWFNPLVWRLRRHLQAQCEYACDALVVSLGVNPKEYASALCDVAESPARPATSLAMAGGAPLRSRVEHLLARPGRKPHFLITTVLCLSATAALALSVVRVTPAPFDNHGYDAKELKLRLGADPFPED